jgi:hypothetical protein
MIKKILKKILPNNLIEFLKIKMHERLVLKSNFEDHLTKQKTIQFYAKKYQINIFIETGTYIGRMVKAQLPFFNTIISVELSEQLYKFNRNKFRKYNKVTILQGDSANVLPPVIAELKEPALFWLDGHYSAGLTAKGSLNTPISKELSCILENKYNHCILIDDARLFNGTNDYPEFRELKSSVSAKKPHSAVIIENDIIIITYA